MRTSIKEINHNMTIQRILDLLAQKNIKQKELTDYLGISTSVFTNWKYRNGSSYFNYLDQIATFLNVSPDYLLNGEKKSVSELTSREENLINLYRQIDETSRQTIDELIEYLWLKNMGLLETV